MCQNIGCWFFIFLCLVFALFLSSFFFFPVSLFCFCFSCALAHGGFIPSLPNLLGTKGALLFSEPLVITYSIRTYNGNQ
jgi:hypothetical protein